MFDYIYWNPDPEIANVFGFSLRYYSLLFVGGILLSLYSFTRLFKNENISSANLEKLVIYVMVGIVLGARLGHCLFYEPSYYLSHPLEILLPVQFLPDGGFKFTGYQGLASHGGALGVLIALVIYSLKTKEPLLKILDLIAIVGPLEGVFIRLGNLMNSEIIGTPTTKPWAFVFERVDNIPRHPSQIYEAAAYLLIFGIVVFMYKKKGKELRHGFFFGLTLVLVFTARFLIEFVKERQVSFEENMTFDMGQLLSIPYILVGIGFIIYGMKGRNKDQTSLDGTA